MKLSEAIRKYDSVLSERHLCPRVGCALYRPFFAMVDHLTFEHGWSRGQIADWVAEWEKRLGITEES